jgi:hypothetical protein
VDRERVRGKRVIAISVAGEGRGKREEGGGAAPGSSDFRIL